MYSDFAKREKTPQEILLEEALKDAQDIPQAHTDWWELEASDEEIDAYYDLAWTAEFNPDAEIIRYLVANGADVRARDMYRNTARIYLKRNKILAQNREISAFLRKLERKAWWNNFVQKFRK